MKPRAEHMKLGAWDDDGKPSLYEYQGAGKLKGETALITGGDSGIGRAVANMYAQTQDAEDVKKELEGVGAKVNLIKGDLMDEGHCKSVVNSHLQAFGKLNILVNNAPKQIFCKDAAEIDLKTVESTFRSNILQMFAVTKFALPHLHRGSSIINTTSVTAYAGSPALLDYSSTKGAIVTFTRSLAQQLAPKGIRVNGVAPGPVFTPLQPASRSADNMEGWGVGTPLHGRAAQPAELGPVYVFLASPDSNCMTGQIVHVNNGQHIGAS